MTRHPDLEVQPRPRGAPGAATRGPVPPPTAVPRVAVPSVLVGLVVIVVLVMVMVVMPRPASAAAPQLPPSAVASSPTAPSQAGWGWPLDGPPRLVRGFQPPPQPWLAGHRGVDLLGSPGLAVRASGPGRVSFAGSVAGTPVVVITHPGGLRTTYEPVVRTLAVGDEVVRGTVIGSLSAAGSHCLPRACLHWGLRRGEAYLDPLAMMGASLRVRLLPVWGPLPWPVATPQVPPDAVHVGALSRARMALRSEQ
ncbi:MAG: M23 family metallopeptidase [Actinomycetes bacterium]